MVAGGSVVHCIVLIIIIIIPLNGQLNLGDAHGIYVSQEEYGIFLNENGREWVHLSLVRAITDTV